MPELESNTSGSFPLQDQDIGGQQLQHLLLKRRLKRHTEPRASHSAARSEVSTQFKTISEWNYLDANITYLIH